MTKAPGICGLALLWSLAAFAAEPWTLERALKQALAANPDARLAQQRIVAEQAGLDQANDLGQARDHKHAIQLWMR